MKKTALRSLVSPPADNYLELTFYILKTPVEMSAAQLAQFKKIFPMNARPVMPLNGRKVSEGG